MQKKMKLHKIKQKVLKAQKIGFINILMCYYTRFRFGKLQKKYNFDPWHCNGNWYCRPYQRKAVKLIDNLNPKSVIEIGCGLGEVITRVNANYKVGYDIETSVIEAAKSIRGLKVNFKVGTGKDVVEDNIDVLVAINWIHNLSPSQLTNFLKPFYSRVSFFLLEGIYKDEPGYKFCHDFNFLKKQIKLIDVVDGGIGEPRKLMLFKVIKNVC